MKVLLINTHLNYPAWSEGKLNQNMMDAAKSFYLNLGHSVIETHVEAGYNTEDEVKKHVDADLVILQTPINWFGAPWIYKKYIDEVFNTGLKSKVFLDNDGRTKDDPTRQYGTGGHMQGKRFMIATTWNAPVNAFNNPEGTLMEGKSVDDLLLNITCNYKFVGYDILPSYGIYDIYRNGDIAKEIEDYTTRLSKTI